MNKTLKEVYRNVIISSKWAVNKKGTIVYYMMPFLGGWRAWTWRNECQKFLARYIKNRRKK